MTVRPARALRLGLALAALLGATTATPAAAQGIAGPYLAAEHAARIGDLDAAAENFSKVLARDPDNVPLIQRAMLHQTAAGRIPRAVALARRLEQLSPGEHLAHLLLAAEAARNDDFEAVGALFDAESRGRDAFVGRLMAAWGAAGAGDAAAGETILAGMEDEDLGGQAGRFIAAYHRGLLATATGDDATAIGHFERAAEISGGSDVRLTRVRARTLARLGRAEEAQAAVAETLSRTLSNARLERLADDLAAGRRPEPLVGDAGEGIAEALYGVARFMVRRNRLVGLAHARLATHLRPGLVQAHILIGSELRRAEQPMLAVAAYEAVPDSAPEALDARIGAAEARESAGMLDEAVAELRGVVARWPDSVDAHTALGDMLRRNERFAEAATAYDGAIALIGEPEQRHWPLFYTRGICHERSDQWPLAEADFQKALELEPEQPQVLNYLGYSWVEMRTNLEEAEAMIRRAVEQRPDDGYIVDSLGWVLFRLGEFEGAVKHLERAVELRPVDPVINDHFGDALWMVGRRTEAEFQWKRALSFDPEPEEAERIRDKLERGLDAVIADEAAAGEPAIIGRGGEAGADANDDG